MEDPGPQLQGLWCHQCSTASLATVQTGPQAQLCPRCGSEFVELRPDLPPQRAAQPDGDQQQAHTPQQQHQQQPDGHQVVVSRIQVMVPGAEPGTWQELYSGEPGGHGPGMPGLPTSVEALLQHLNQGGSRYRGLPAEAVAALPRVKVQAAQAGAKGDEGRATAGQECAVCQDTFAEGTEVVQLPCRHCFHEGCIAPWLEGHRTCPECRHQLSSPGGGSEQPADGLSAAMEHLLGELGSLQDARLAAESPGPQEAPQAHDSPGPEALRGPASVPWLLEVFHNELEVHQLLWGRYPTLHDFERLWPGSDGVDPALPGTGTEGSALPSSRPPQPDNLPQPAAAPVQPQMGHALHFVPHRPLFGALQPHPRRPVPFPHGRWVPNEPDLSLDTARLRPDPAPHSSWLGSALRAAGSPLAVLLAGASMLAGGAVQSWLRRRRR